MSLQTAFYFFVFCCLLALLPGPDNLYVLNQSAREGWRTGVSVILGLCSGLIVHTTIVALGVAEIIKQSSHIFWLISIFGAAYLIYLAYLIYKAPPIYCQSNSPATPQKETLSKTLLRSYRRGVLMNLSNPKVIIFFLSFTQPFINPALGNITQQYVILGIIFIVSTFLVFGAICCFANYFGKLLRKSPAAQILFNRIVAFLLLILALYLLISDFFKTALRN